MTLDVNSVNNLFRQGGSVGASLGSSEITSTLDKHLFSKIGNVPLLGNVGGFLGSQITSTIRTLLFARVNPQQHYDPVWKLNRTQVSNSGIPPGDLTRAIGDDLAYANRPKSKFNFTVSFDFRASMLNKLIDISYSVDDAIASAGDDDMATMAFGLKQAGRPNPSIVYQDVNFYNYRTKVATKIDYGTVTITFYDDITNRAHDIFAAYLNTISPISNMANVDFAGQFDVIGASPELFNTANSGVAPLDTSSIGALANQEEAGLIRMLTLTQHLPIQNSQTPLSGPNVAENSVTDVSVAPILQYKFYNPKIISMNLDDMDMCSNDPATLSLTFTYDGVYVVKSSTTSSLVDVKSVADGKSMFAKFLDSVDGVISPRVDSVNHAISSAQTSTVARELQGLTND